MDTTNQLIYNINKNYTEAEKLINENKLNECAKSIRAALENAVSLVWNKKHLYNLPLKNGNIDLMAAIADFRFRKNFFDMTISDMQGIRQITANVFSGIIKLSATEAKDLLSRLKNIIRIISEKLDHTILDTNANPAIQINNKEIKQMSETQKFWNAFNELLMENGDPFSIAIDGEKGTISKNAHGSLEIKFQPFKQSFKIGIYTSDKAAWNALNMHKQEINAKLAIKPIWGVNGTNYYIESQMGSAFFTPRPYRDIINEALIDISLYVESFGEYMKNIDSSVKFMLPTILHANLQRGFGGNAKEIYLAGCRQFEWKEELKNEFGMMRILYATHATPEDYSVWCLCKIAQKVDDDSFINWDEVDAIHESGKNWANILFSDGSKIYEIWKNIGPDFPGYYNDNTTRLTLVKCKYTNNEYAFAGIYKPMKLEDRVINGKVYHIKHYQRIAETYGK